MEIYINTRDCILQNNHWLLPTIEEIKKIKGNLKEMEKNISSIDIELYNEKIYNEIYNIQNVKSEIIKEKIGYIYVYRDLDLYKIWKTLNIKDRNKKYITENPRAIMIHNYKTNNYDEEELILHKKFEDKRIRWEWLKLNEKDILYIKSKWWEK